MEIAAENGRVPIRPLGAIMILAVYGFAGLVSRVGGYLDDAAVIVWVIGLVEEELEKFRDWERRPGAQVLAAVESDARAAGVAKAEQTSAFGWAVFGFMIPAVAVLVVHLRSPKVPAEVVASASDDPSVARVFEAQYVETLKSKQVTNAWLGAALGLFVVLAVVILF